ncbi:MAG TPA: hypothetical protein VD903_08390 [Pseudonocardia sp.]|nr:hypothetical protein [Pseudonocardia sp.]
MRSLVSGLLRGAAAGAAGTTALTATTYTDMAVRARPASDAPQQVVARLADAAGVVVPGRRRERARRLSALGVLAGTATGVGIGGLAGLLRAVGVRMPTAVGGPLLGLGAMAASDGPLAVLRISDPRRWSAVDWAADAVPHLVYGCTTHATLVAVSRVAEGREAVPHASPSALLRAAALGAATGARSTAGITAVALTSRPDDTGAVASRLGGRAGSALAVVAAAGELVADKTPGVPSRIAPPGLVPRIALGATSASAVARRDGHDNALPGLIGAASAVGAAVLGVRLRAVAARRFGTDKPGALAEDALAALLGWLGARRPAAAAAPETTVRPLRR